MGDASCPFCNSKKIFNISYGYLGGKKKNKPYYIDQEEVGTNYNYRKKIYVKYDFDGERLSHHLPNRFCKNCGKTFQSRKVMYTADISIVTLVVCINEDYYKYIFDFSNKKKPNYTLKINWIPIKVNESLTVSEQNKLLSSFKKYKPNMWNGHYGQPYDYDKYYWILKCTYYNGLDYVRSGNDKIPNDWKNFIQPFKEIFKENIFDLWSF